MSAPSERPKLCYICGSISDRVVGPKCRRCGLRFEPDTIPCVFSKPRLVKFTPPPEEQPKVKRVRAEKVDSSIVRGSVIAGWRVLGREGERVMLECFGCNSPRTVTRAHVQNARRGEVRIWCRRCTPNLRSERG